MSKRLILRLLRHFGYTALRIGYLEEERAGHRRAIEAEAGLRREGSRLSAALKQQRSRLETLALERDQALARERHVLRELSKARMHAADAEAELRRRGNDLTAKEAELRNLRSDLIRRTEHTLHLLRARQAMIVRRMGADAEVVPDHIGGESLREAPTATYGAGQDVGRPGGDGQPDMPTEARGEPAIDRRLIEVLADHEQTLEELVKAYSELEELRNRVESGGSPSVSSSSRPQT